MKASIFALLALILVGGCAQRSHASAPAQLGKATTLSRLKAVVDQPGPIELTKIRSADWQIDLSGLLDLDHPKAVQAGIQDKKEPIQIYMYALEHPERGSYLIDSGVARSIAQRHDDMPVGSLVRSFMDLDALEVHVDTRTWLERHPAPIAGVFLTHLHLDHVLGVTDIPANVPIYVGPGEAADSKFMYLFSRSTTDRNLSGRPALFEWGVQKVPGEDLGVVDVFGDSSLFALHVPGHTQGNMGFVVRTPEGSHLLTGDGCHTAWGWEHGVAPGTFNTDGERAQLSLAALEAFAKDHPKLTVHVGHQALPCVGEGCAALANH